MALHFLPTITPAIQLILIIISVLMMGVSWNNYVEKTKHAHNFPSPETRQTKRNALTLAIIVGGCGALLFALIITWFFITKKNKSSL